MFTAAQMFWPEASAEASAGSMNSEVDPLWSGQFLGNYDTERERERERGSGFRVCCQPSL